MARSAPRAHRRKLMWLYFGPGTTPESHGRRDGPFARSVPESGLPRNRQFAGSCAANSAHQVQLLHLALMALWTGHAGFRFSMNERTPIRLSFANARPHRYREERGPNGGAVCYRTGSGDPKSGSRIQPVAGSKCRVAAYSRLAALERSWNATGDRVRSVLSSVRWASHRIHCQAGADRHGQGETAKLINKPVE